MRSLRLPSSSGALAAALVLAACGSESSSRVTANPAVCTDGDPDQQRHGATCLCCHSEFGAAGSIDPNGAPVAIVVVTDAHGEVATMSPNQFGNFFRHFDMTPPLQASVVSPTGETRSMQENAPSGDCNSCHALGRVAPPIHGP